MFPDSFAESRTLLREFVSTSLFIRKYEWDESKDSFSRTLNLSVGQKTNAARALRRGKRWKIRTRRRIEKEQTLFLRASRLCTYVASPEVIYARERAAIFHVRQEELDPPAGFSIFTEIQSLLALYDYPGWQFLMRFTALD